MRGVFFISIFVFCISVSATAFQFNGNYQGRFDHEGIVQDLVLHIARERPGFRFLGGGSFVLETGRFELRPHLQTQVLYRDRLGLSLQKNQPHYTSGDLFGQLHKDNFSKDTASVVLGADQIQIGFLHNVPLRHDEQANLWFCENQIETGPFAVRGMHLYYSGLAMAGQAGSLEANLSLAQFETLLALGWHRQENGSAKARAAEIRARQDAFFINLFYQAIEPGFVSLAAKNNKYTPDRRGWRLEAGGELSGLALSANLRRHENFAGTRNYDQLAFQLTTKGPDVSLQLRLLPTRALVARYTNGRRLIQLDVLNGTFRYDVQLTRFMYGLRFDFVRGIKRFELRGSLENGLNWRAVGKFDWLKQRTHYSFSLGQPFRGGDAQLELGEYDRGNMHSGFGTLPRLSISWQREF